MDDDEIRKSGWVKRTRREHSLRSTPRVGQVYWVDFPADAYSPEFVNEHPGVIVRAANNMSDVCIVVPITHSDGAKNPHAHRLARNPDPLDNRDSWVVCNHLYTVALGRLRRFEKRGYERDVRLDHTDLEQIFTNIQRVLAQVFSGPKPFVPPPARPRQRGPNTLSLEKRD